MRSVARVQRVVLIAVRHRASFGWHVRCFMFAAIALVPLNFGSSALADRPGERVMCS